MPPCCAHSNREGGRPEVYDIGYPLVFTPDMNFPKIRGLLVAQDGDDGKAAGQ